MVETRACCVLFALLAFAGCVESSGSCPSGSESCGDGGTSTTLRILPLGDSITEGADHSYRYALYSSLCAAGLSFDFIGSQRGAGAHSQTGWDIDHEGHSGWATHDIAAHIGTWLQTYTPDVVLLHLGTNDMVAITYGVYEGVYEGRFSVGAAIAAVESTVDTIRGKNPGVATYVAQILPSPEPDPIFPINDHIANYNARLQEFVQAKHRVASPIVVVDMNTGFGAADLVDGVHPNEAGAGKMASVWARAILRDFQ